MQKCGMNTGRSEEVEKGCAIFGMNHCVERRFVSA
jgi:hypothetical protein